MRICVMRGRRMTYILQMYTQRQRTTGPKQKNKRDQVQSPITGNDHSKSIENYSQYHSCLQSQGIATRLTPVPQELYVALFEVKLQFSKVPLLPVPVMQTAPPCKQVDRTTQPHTHTQTHTQTTVSPCMHSFIHSFNPPYSLYHSFTRTNQASPLPFITIYNHPSIINHALHGPHSMAFVHARMTLPWLAHNEMECICMHTACQPPPYRDTSIHACIEKTTSSHPLNVLMSIFGGGHGGDIDHRVGTAASLLLRVDS